MSTHGYRVNRPQAADRLLGFAARARRLRFVPEYLTPTSRSRRWAVRRGELGSA
jgi:hypothetical protein